MAEATGYLITARSRSSAPSKIVTGSSAAHPLRTRVMKIVVTGDKAAGVVLEGVKRWRLTLSFCRGRPRDHLPVLEGRFLNDKIRHAYSSRASFPPCRYLGIGATENEPGFSVCT
jgi:hypothetical protein